MARTQGCGRRYADLLCDLAIVLGGIALVGSVLRRSTRRSAASSYPPRDARPSMILIPWGRFRPGCDSASDDALEIIVEPFWIDAREVTVREFARFVDATGYVTSAERAGRSWVFNLELGKWQLVAGANWREPAGPHSSALHAIDRPLVQVSWFDAAAFAGWSRKRLPTEAEWEFAARLGNERVWAAQPTAEARESSPSGTQALAVATSIDHVKRTCLLSMAARVWEWCADWYSSAMRRQPVDSRSKLARETHRVQRGGSWLSAGNEALNEEFWTREKQLPHACHNHAGFRCVRSA